MPVFRFHVMIISTFYERFHSGPLIIGTTYVTSVAMQYAIALGVVVLYGACINFLHVVASPDSRVMGLWQI